MLELLNKHVWKVTIIDVNTQEVEHIFVVAENFYQVGAEVEDSYIGEQSEKAIVSCVLVSNSQTYLYHD